MDSFEFNKIFAAVLVTGILMSLLGFASHSIVKSDELEEHAYKIEGVEEAGSSHGHASSKPAGPEPVLALLASADPTRGEKLSKACAACHTFNAGGANGLGPNLYGVLNRAKGSAPGFKYSDGMLEKGGVWDYDSLNHFLWKPKAYVTGTKMNYIGLRKPEDRAAMIAWLRTLAGSKAALPSADAIAKEAAAMGGGEEAAH